MADSPDSPPLPPPRGAAEEQPDLRPPGYGEICRFSFPLMLGLATVGVHAIVDTAFVGQLGTAQLAALGFVNLFYFTGQVLLFGLMRNSVAFTARAFGARELTRIGGIVAHYQWLALAGWPVILIFALNFPWVAALAGLTPELMGYAQEYLWIRVWESGFMLTLILYSAFYQAIGNSRFPMLIQWGGVAANVVLDYGLIFGNLGLPAMGIRGSALATVLANAGALAVALAVTYRPSFARRYGMRFLVWPDWALLRRILAVGVPHGFGDLVEVASFMGFFVVVGRLGEASLAATNIGVQVTHLLFMPGFAAGFAAASYMGRFLGAKSPDVAAIATRRTLVVGMTYMGVMGVPLWFFGGEIAAIFTKDAEVIALSALVFKIMAFYQVFDGMGLILRGALNGAADTRFPVVALICCSLGVLYPAAFLFAEWITPSVVGAWVGVILYIVVLGFVLLFRFRQGRWRDTELEPGTAVPSGSDRVAASDGLTPAPGAAPAGGSR